jgi:hypothetical protein
MMAPANHPEKNKQGGKFAALQFNNESIFRCVINKNLVAFNSSIS